MRKSLCYCLALVAFCQVGFAADNTPPEGFKALFNGKDFTGWHGMPHYDPVKLANLPEEERAALLKSWNEDLLKHWKVENGVIVNDGEGVYLTTDDSFTDYELLVDYKMFPKGDSGLYLKANPQVQIWDFNQTDDNLGPDRVQGSGGLWNNSPGKPGKDPLVKADKAIGEWNHFRVVQIGARTSVWLNDQLVVDNAIMENYFDRKSPLFKSGQLQLQTHGSEIQWKNIYLREIPTEEANKTLKEKAGEGFTSIFNGKDFTGWQGGIDGYEIVDGAIRGKEGRGDVLFTEKEYGDFVVQLEFKLPPAGNNGLAIRYPGKGGAAYDGMCELQVLDSEHENYKTIDPRQAHGSIYGMVPAARGYLRKTGDWNYEIVTVQGPRITVELNGNVIVDGDVSTVTEFMGGTPHPGKDRTSGFFGFAGHNDPVEFRNIEIKELAK
ncbi:3-keto-disaccharide hydrolase [Planctomicrobium sp. SH661]|uniref:3-keto-disaccharide hydrolase n=1 Tax=Planctomicrobium sp. SH661 TaxID=3448124 RepID=UPI003F5CA467